MSEYAATCCPAAAGPTPQRVCSVLPDLHFEEQVRPSCEIFRLCMLAHSMPSPCQHGGVTVGMHRSSEAMRSRSGSTAHRARHAEGRKGEGEESRGEERGGGRGGSAEEAGTERKWDTWEGGWRAKEWRLQSAASLASHCQRADRSLAKRKPTRHERRNAATTQGQAGEQRYCGIFFVP